MPPMPQPQPPETVEIVNCQVGKAELPGGAMALVFTIPGIRRYSFVLDDTGRKMVAQLCGLTIVGKIDGRP
jgi:signal recognition particle receptor subunit beta